MKQRLLLLLTMFLAVVTTGCEFSDPDGRWTPMKWAKNNYQKEKNDDGMMYYIVPKEGGTFTFRCNNYPNFWLSPCTFSEYGYGKTDEVTAYPDSADDPKHLSCEWCDVSVVDNALTIVFQEGQHSSRMAKIEVTAGDIFDAFNFRQ